MRLEPEWTSAFLRLKNKLEECQYGTWVFVDKKTENKYSNINLNFVYRTKASVDNYFEYKSETEKDFILVRTFLNFVSISKREREDELNNNMEVVAALNEERELNIDEIMYYMNWSKNKEYEYYEFQ